MTKRLKGFLRLLPPGFRHEFSTFIFRDLKKTGILVLLRYLGIITCNDYIQVDPTSAAELTTASNGMIKFHTLTDENTTPTRPAIHLGGHELDAIQPLIAKTETIVLDIAVRGFSLRNNHLFDPQMNVLDEAELQFEKMPVYRRLLSKATKVEGTVAYLSNVEPTNYYHWMCRALPLLRVYRKFFDLAEIDRFYLGEFSLANFHQESLAKVGIAPAQIVQTACTADHIIAAFSNRVKHSEAAPITKENYDFSRSLFQTEIEQYSKPKLNRIYVSRGTVARRRVLNEPEVIALLAKYGFQSISMDGKTLQDQIKIFANAEAIVAPHGAALTNLLFVRPGTKVIELLPDGYANNCFYVLADYAAANYAYLQGEKTNQIDIDDRKLDLIVDINKLEQLCKTVLSQKIELSE